MNMKLEKHQKIGIAILVSLVLFIAIVYAAYWQYSNTVSVTVGYALKLTYDQTGSNITLIANLTNTGTGAPVLAATIHFYNCTTDGTIINELGLDNTNSEGIATYLYSADHDAKYNFKAGYWVS